MMDRHSKRLMSDSLWSVSDVSIGLAVVSVVRRIHAAGAYDPCLCFAGRVAHCLGRLEPCSPPNTERRPSLPLLYIQG